MNQAKLDELTKDLTPEQLFIVLKEIVKLLDEQKKN